MTNHNNKIIHHHKNHLLPPPPATRSNSTIQACAACRYQRRKCAPDCILAPYFPHDRQRQFQNAHKLFGVSNITKIIRNLDRPQKDEAMRTIIYQSDVRSIDPVGGCYRIIRELQRQIEISCAELEFVLQQLALYRTLTVQNNQQFNHDLIVIDEIDYDIHLVNNHDEPQLYVETLENHKDHDSGWEDNHAATPVQSWSSVRDSPPPSQPLHASVCDEFKSLLIHEIAPGERNESSEKSLFDEDRQKDLIKVENVCYNEEQFEILADHKAIHVEGEYGS
ncbi:hypothetical protein L1987_70529 [Smallanthus sonchifolius]|uniref:Uncharacterized protein n=1 Tax=Smallanthus sonchifolius TaxID=185202 RepID=A0ACB9APY2_9ASTR|nr:hypothetical protein L1987_70529 [Smallanthus sonchifolius]